MNSGNYDSQSLVRWGFALSAALMAPVSGQAQTALPEAAYNPQPKPGDVTLPMPCGGGMTFRAIAVPSTGMLDDRRVQLGGSDSRFTYAENTRSDYIAGGFADTKVKGQKYYLLGKYEVTRLQYDAVVAAACPAQTKEGRFPQAEITWIEAMTFANRYSSWLAKNAIAKLPVDGGSPGFVRLPTEAEWEFAARGGVAVDNVTFEQTRFPMTGEPSEYMWFGSTLSSSNSVNSIGLLKPNPLGLHDVLGNVGEFVLDSYRLNKHSHLHGQAGGFIVKGGDFRTRLPDIRAASREEYVPVDRSGERRSDAIGMRVAIVPPTLPSRKSVTDAQEAWDAASRTAPMPGETATAKPAASTAAVPAPSLAGAPVFADPVQEVDALTKLTTDPALKQRLLKIGTVLKTNIQSRNEQRDRSAKSQIEVGTYLARIINRDTIRNDLLRSLNQPADVIAKNDSIINDNMIYIIDVIRQIGLDFPALTIEQQGEVLKREFEARGRASYATIIALVVDYARRARNGQAIDKAKLRSELTKLKT